MTGSRRADRVHTPTCGACFRVATYNIHGWRGTWGKFAPERICGVIRELNANFIGLQEVLVPGGNPAGPEKMFTSLPGLYVASGITQNGSRGWFGNVLLSSVPFLRVRLHDLSFRKREPRGIIDVDLDIAGSKLRILVTHLGLQGAERHWQVKKLLKVIAQEPQSPMLLMGDFNDWFAAFA